MPNSIAFTNPIITPGNVSYEQDADFALVDVDWPFSVTPSNATICRDEAHLGEIIWALKMYRNQCHGFGSWGIMGQRNFATGGTNETVIEVAAQMRLEFDSYGNGLWQLHEDYNPMDLTWPQEIILNWGAVHGMIQPFDWLETDPVTGTAAVDPVGNPLLLIIQGQSHLITNVNYRTGLLKTWEKNSPVRSWSEDEDDPKPEAWLWRMREEYQYYNIGQPPILSSSAFGPSGAFVDESLVRMNIPEKVCKHNKFCGAALFDPIDSLDPAYEEGFEYGWVGKATYKSALTGLPTGATICALTDPKNMILNEESVPGAKDSPFDIFPSFKNERSAMIGVDGLPTIGLCAGNQVADPDPEAEPGATIATCTGHSEVDEPLRGTDRSLSVMKSLITGKEAIIVQLLPLGPYTVDITSGVSLEISFGPREITAGGPDDRPGVRFPPGKALSLFKGSGGPEVDDRHTHYAADAAIVDNVTYDAETDSLVTLEAADTNVFGIPGVGQLYPLKYSSFRRARWMSGERATEYSAIARFNPDREDIRTLEDVTEDLTNPVTIDRACSLTADMSYAGYTADPVFWPVINELGNQVHRQSTRTNIGLLRKKYSVGAPQQTVDLGYLFEPEGEDTLHSNSLNLGNSFVMTGVVSGRNGWTFEFAAGWDTPYALHLLPFVAESFPRDILNTQPDVWHNSWLDKIRIGDSMVIYDNDDEKYYTYQVIATTKNLDLGKDSITVAPQNHFPETGEGHLNPPLIGRTVGFYRDLGRVWSSTPSGGASVANRLWYKSNVTDDWLEYFDFELWPSGVHGPITEGVPIPRYHLYLPTPIGFATELLFETSDAMAPANIRRATHLEELRNLVKNYHTVEYGFSDTDTAVWSELGYIDWRYGGAGDSWFSWSADTDPAPKVDGYEVRGFSSGAGILNPTSVNYEHNVRPSTLGPNFQEVVSSAQIFVLPNSIHFREGEDIKNAYIWLRVNEISVSPPGSTLNIKAEFRVRTRSDNVCINGFFGCKGRPRGYGSPYGAHGNYQQVHYPGAPDGSDYRTVAYLDANQPEYQDQHWHHNCSKGPGFSDLQGTNQPQTGSYATAARLQDFRAYSISRWKPAGAPTSQYADGNIVNPTFENYHKGINRTDPNGLMCKHFAGSKWSPGIAISEGAFEVPEGQWFKLDLTDVMQQVIDIQKAGNEIGIAFVPNFTDNWQGFSKIEGPAYPENPYDYTYAYDAPSGYVEDAEGGYSRSAHYTVEVGSGILVDFQTDLSGPDLKGPPMFEIPGLRPRPE